MVMPDAALFCIVFLVLAITSLRQEEKMRIPTKALNQYPWYLRLLLTKQLRSYGRPLDPTLLWARVPRLQLVFMLFFAVLTRRKSMVSAQVRTLVSVRVSQINWCPFCVDLNSMLWLKTGGSQRKLERLQTWRTEGDFAPEERAALDYAEAMTNSELRVTDDLFQTLRQHFADDAIVELTAAIGFQNMSSKFNAAFDAQPYGFCQKPTSKVDI